MTETIETFEQILSCGIEAKASDWHIKEGTPISLRIAGDMVPIDFTPTKEFMDKLLKEISDETLYETYKKTGDMDLSYSFKDKGRFRVNAHRQRGMHAMTLRHVKNKIFTLEQLGLPQVLYKIASFERGIVMVCGTTGSGKSTTLAAMLNYINKTYPKHIITIEDPVEYEFTDDKSFFEQRELGMDVISFASALSHALRQDPDIIMVGEMRDKESFEAALHAADTGHMVLSTVHAANASQVVGRILDFYPKAEQDSIRESLSLNLRATIAQRLLPKAFGGGVVPVNEIMINNPVIEKYLSKNELDRLPDAIAAGSEEGMQTFNQSILKCINNGDITEDTALKASSNPEELKMNMKGIFLSGAKK